MKCVFIKSQRKLAFLMQYVCMLLKNIDFYLYILLTNVGEAHT